MNPLNRFVLLLLVYLVFAASWRGFGAEPSPPRAALPWMKQAPTIDGTIDEAEWKYAVRSIGLVSEDTGAAAQRQGMVWIGADAQRLYLAMKTEVAPDERILTRAVPDVDRDVPAVLHDDCLELVLDPQAGRGGGNREVFHLLANARGTICDWTTSPASPAAKDFSWRLAGWQFSQRIIDGWWHVEMSVPLASLGVAKDGLVRACGISLGRQWKRPGERSLWGAGSGDAAALAQVTFDQAAPVVRVLSLGGDKEPTIRLAVFNPHPQPIEVNALMIDTWHRDPPRELRQRVRVAPGAESELLLKLSDGPQGLHNTLLRIASIDGSRVFYERAWRWSNYPSESRWTIGDEQRQGLTLQFKYYPYENKVGFRVSAEAMSLRDRITGATAFIRQADLSSPAKEAKPGPEDKSVVWRQALEWKSFVAEAVCDVPRLAQGTYVFGVQLAGGVGVPREPVEQPFARQVFPWENNRLGISDEVMPPFTPLTSDGPTVRAVLRQHRHGPGGLWESVSSEGQPLLAGPMTWEVVAEQPGQSAGQLGDKSLSRGRALASEQTALTPGPSPETGEGRRDVQGGAWRVTTHKPTRVTGQSQWSAGPVKARVDTEYDYDGMMLVTLHLEPTAGKRVQRISLNIPLRESLARYMHAVGDGLRSNYAGSVPRGEGRVWDSSKAAKQEIVGTFYPYLWVGDGQRGLCWFADTDRDWVLDDRTPAVELVREKGVLSMRVHFITRPGPLTRKHRIVFGLQATPTKPMPEGWRRWTAHGQIQGGRPVRWLGACFYWGGLSYDVYPYKYQFDFYDKLREARQTGKVDRAFIDRWMAMVDRELARKGTDRYKFFLAHVNAGFYSSSGSTWQKGARLFGYTNPRGVGFHVPEFATFQDEWLRYRYFNRNWGQDADVGYDVDPAPSFQDYALWYYRKMLDCFDGVYWDNMFLSANFDPVVGRAWTDEQGRVHPTFGLMHLRELAKRTAVMLWQESKDLPAHRKPPITLAHMTNTLIVPVLSFVNCTMDWEWKYGYEDFQDRFTPELTVTETIGRQVGAWPTILAGGHPDHKDPRVDFLWRTRLGVCLTHEVQVFDWAPARDGQIYAKLFEFGYGADDCRTFNYWEPGHPLRVEGLRACTLALARNGAAVVVVTDYSGGGECRVALDLTKLGLQPAAAASDLETGAPVQRAAPGVFSFPLKKHDFRILKVQ